MSKGRLHSIQPRLRAVLNEAFKPLVTSLIDNSSELSKILNNFVISTNEARKKIEASHADQ